MAARGENGGRSPEIRNKSPTFITTMNAVNTLTHLCLGAIAIGAIMHANLAVDFAMFSSSLYQHIYLCVTGYVVLMSQAIMTMSPYNGWASMLKHKDRKTIHWIMQVCGSILAIAGSAIRIANVQNHFNSAHGALASTYLPMEYTLFYFVYRKLPYFYLSDNIIRGIIALAFTCLTLINGVLNLFSSNLGIKPNVIRISHACLGSLTIICAFICLILGFNFAYSVSNFGMLTAFTVFALLGLITPPCLRLFSR